MHLCILNHSLVPFEAMHNVTAAHGESTMSQVIHSHDYNAARHTQATAHDEMHKRVERKGGSRWQTGEKRAHAAVRRRQRADLLLSFWPWSFIPPFEVSSSTVIDQVKTQGWPVTQIQNKPPSVSHQQLRTLLLDNALSHLPVSAATCSNLQWNIIST